MSNPFIEIVPEVEVPEKMSGNIINKTIDDSVDGTIQYEVVGRSADSIRIKVKGIVFNNKNVRV